MFHATIFRLILLTSLVILEPSTASNSSNEIECQPDEKTGRIRYENCLVNHLLLKYIKEERPSAEYNDTVNLKLHLELQQVR